MGMKESFIAKKNRFQWEWKNRLSQKNKKEAEPLTWRRVIKLHPGSDHWQLRAQSSDQHAYKLFAFGGSSGGTCGSSSMDKHLYQLTTLILPRCTILEHSAYSGTLSLPIHISGGPHVPLFKDSASLSQLFFCYYFCNYFFDKNVKLFL